MTTQAEIIDLVRDGKRYREKRNRWVDFWVAFVVSLIIAPLDGWLFMLAIGIVHHEWWPAVPTIGYVWATVLAAFFNAVFSTRSRRAAS